MPPARPCSTPPTSCRKRRRCVIGWRSLIAAGGSPWGGGDPLDGGQRQWTFRAACLDRDSGAPRSGGAADHAGGGHAGGRVRRPDRPHAGRGYPGPMSTAVLPRLRRRLGAALATARMRLLVVSRYPGQLFVEIFIPIVFASMPILLARANADSAGASFQRNVGTSNYIAYMLLGSGAFMIVSMAFWHIGYWLRYEQETGTLEAMYLAPTGRVWLAAGVSLYSSLRAILSGGLAYLLGSLIFGVDPLQGQVALAAAFVLVGLVPLFGMTLLFGALILRVKEANSLVNLMQWVISLMMGIFFPVAVFPPLMRALALLFPPTWMVNGVRSAMLGVGYFFGEWYWDLAMLWAFLLLAPPLGYTTFSRMQRGLRRKEGMGGY